MDVPPVEEGVHPHNGIPPSVFIVTVQVDCSWERSKVSHTGDVEALRVRYAGVYHLHIQEGRCYWPASPRNTPRLLLGLEESTTHHRAQSPRKKNKRKKLGHLVFSTSNMRLGRQAAFGRQFAFHQQTHLSPEKRLPTSKRVPGTSLATMRKLIGMAAKCDDRVGKPVHSRIDKPTCVL